MTKVERIERDIAALSDLELAEFRRWYAEFDDEAWDRQLEPDALSGTLDRLLDKTHAVD